MNWQHLTYFLTTAKLQNFSRAAEQLYITPSALSKAIRNLENELGFPLFEKSGRVVGLTEYGRMFSEYVVKASKNIEDGIFEVQKRMGLHTGRIAISGIYTMCGDYVPSRIMEFNTDHPNVTYAIEYAITSKILEKIISGSSDLGFCGDYELDSDHFSSIERKLIKVEDLVVVTPKNHPLAKKERIEFKKLSKEKFIIYRNVNSGISYIFWKLCNQYDIKPKIAFEVPDDHSIVGLVAAGLGIALLPDNVSIKMNDLAILKIYPHMPTRNQYMIWKKERFMAPVVEAFRDHISAYTDKNFPELALAENSKG
jgi:DNA-binding transcriptional LysR family regulator